MIYLTGDTHNDFSKLSNKSLKKHGLKFTEDDYMIVTGDFAGRMIKPLTGTASGLLSGHLLRCGFREITKTTI